MESEINKFIESHSKIIKPLLKEMALSYWNATISGKKEDYEKYAKASEKIQLIYNNKGEFLKIKGWLNENINDKLARRQLEILHNSYLSSQGDAGLIKEILKKSSEIERKFNTFRANLEGYEMTDNEIKDILTKNTDSNMLKNAWESSKLQGELVSGEVLELVKLRNKLAKENGFDDFYSMSLFCSEQKLEEIECIFKELELSTNSSFKEVKGQIDKFLSIRLKINKEELRPWHYQDLFFQEGPKIHNVDLDKFYKKDVLKIVSSFYSRIGFDIESISGRSDLYEKKGKEQHAYCMDIDREGDIRVLENIKNDEYWAEATLHEFGHASYQKYINPSLPFILRDNAHIFVTEAIAMFFGRFSRKISFINGFYKISEKEKSVLSREIKESLRLRQIVFARWALVMVNFEKELYKNPSQNLNSLWWALVKKHQLIDFSRNKPDWASKIHLVSAPAYYHNYALGEMLASQISIFLDENNIKGGKIGEYLKSKIFIHGSRFGWDRLIEMATGNPLSPKYFIDEFIK